MLPQKTFVKAYHSLLKSVGERSAIILQTIFDLQKLKSKKDKTPIEETEVYNTYKEWQAKYFPHISERTVQRYILLLEKRGLLKSRTPYAHRGGCLKYYRVNVEAVEAIALACQDIHPSGKDIHSSGKDIPIIYLTIDNQSLENQSSSFEGEEEKKQQEEIAQLMIDEFNKIHVHSKMSLNAFTIAKLLKIWHNTINGNLDEWRRFCVATNTSRFIMGEAKTKKNFKATISWLVNAENVSAVLNGVYTTGDRKQDKPQEHVDMQTKEGFRAYVGRFFKDERNDVLGIKETLKYSAAYQGCFVDFARGKEYEYEGFKKIIDYGLRVYTKKIIEKNLDNTKMLI